MLTVAEFKKKKPRFKINNKKYPIQSYLILIHIDLIELIFYQPVLQVSKMLLKET